MFYFVIALAIGITIGANWKKLAATAWAHTETIWKGDKPEK